MSQVLLGYFYIKNNTLFICNSNFTGSPELYIAILTLPLPADPSQTPSGESFFRPLVLLSRLWASVHHMCFNNFETSGKKVKASFFFFLAGSS